MHTIHLHGAAAERFGPRFRLDVRDCPEAIRALSMQLKGFRDFIQDRDWRVVRGPLARNRELDLQSIGTAIGAARELHLIPVPSGSASGKGIGKILAGIALVAVSFVPGLNVAVAGAIFSLGVSVGLGGLSQVLAKTPKMTDVKDREESPASSLFNGPVNLTEPGNPYPIALGRKVRTGSVVAQAGLSTEQLPT
jgi:predicted phage tail protein